MNDRFNALIHVIRQKPLVAILAIGVLFMVAILAFIQPSSPDTQNQTTRAIPTQTISKTNKKEASIPTRIAPAVRFNTYENKAAVPTIPPTVKKFTFKTGFPDAEIQSFASKFNLKTVEPKEGVYKIFSNLDDPQSRGLLAFNVQNGMWLFQSFGNHTLPAGGTTVNERVKQYLLSLGVIDATVDCSFYYEKKASTVNEQHVECHRSWDQVGLPIFNTVGIINIAENRRLSELRLGVGELMPPDSSITNASDGTSGRSRPNEFNTLTVSLIGDRITSITSTIRPIQITDIVPSSELISPQEALAQLSAQKAQFSLTIPAGSGATSLNWVYPNNMANAQKAEITDFILTYLENPTDVPQKVMVPMYVVKGTALLSSGYSVRFHQVVPAMRNGISSLPPKTMVAGASTQLLAQSGGLRLGSFDPTLTSPGAPNQPAPQISSPAAPPQTSSECIPVANGDGSGVQEFTILVPGMGEMQIVRPIGMTNTFYFKSSTFEVSSIGRVRDLMQVELASQQFEINFARALASNASLLSTSTPTTQDIYSAYSAINSPGLRTPCGTGTMLKAPIAPECIDAQNPNRERMLNAINQATQTIKTSIQNGSLSAKSQQSDIFPSPIPSNMGFLYLVPSLQGENSTISDATDSNACYISGVSPLIYIYPPSIQTLSITLPEPLTYTDPVTNDHTWTVQAHHDGALTVHGQNRTKLYYEYDPSRVQLTPSGGGYSIKREHTEYLIRSSVAKQLQLTDAETDDMVIEAKRVISSLDSPYITIHIADNESVDRGLPLTISSAPTHMYRIHLLIEGSSQISPLPTPRIDPIQREGLTIVEIGARAL